MLVQFIQLSEWIMKVLLRSRPMAILDERYDRLAIVFFGMVWVLYSYTPHIATALFRPSVFQYSESLLLLWIPGASITLFYIIFPSILKLDTVGKILLFGFTGIFGYVLHFMLKGFGIIDFSWYGFYYGNIGLILLLRTMQRKMLGLKTQLEQNLENIDKEIISELKNEWSFLLSKFVQAYLAVAAVLGVCMSILLSGDATIRGITIPSWEDWARMQNAIRMASLFLMESGLYFLFFLAPLLDVLSSFQSLLIAKYQKPIELFKLTLLLQATANRSG